MSSYAGASEHSKAAFIALMITLVCHVVSFGSPYWSTRYDGHAGLWTGCVGKLCYERYNQWVTPWVKVVQAFMILSLMALMFAGLSHFLYIFHRAFEMDKRLTLAATVLTTAAAALTSLAVIVFGSCQYLGNGEALNWPFALACASALGSMAAMVFLQYELRGETTSFRQHE